MSLSKQVLNTTQQQALNTALEMAITARDFDMMTSAVEGGADANLLMFKGVENYQLEWVKAAVERGADVNASMSGLSCGTVLRSNVPYPVFFWLARSCNSDVGDYLLAQGANIDAPAPNGDTALMAAVNIQQKNAIKYLIESGANPLALCADQKFPLKELEENSRLDTDEKLPLLKAMMVNLKTRAAAKPATPVNDPGAAATAQDIEVNRPLELKLKPKPKSGFEL